MSTESPAFGLSANARTQVSPFVIHEPEFHAVLGELPELVKVVDTDAHEGPVYVAAEDALYFTSLPRSVSSGYPEVSIRRLALDAGRFPVAPERITDVRPDANAANGMTLDLDGRLVICEQGSLADEARIARLDSVGGELETLVSGSSGRALNSPNDVVVRSDGTIWFTDPSYGWLQGFRPRPRLGDHVYRYDPGSDRLSVVSDSFDKPNGLAFSPDERVLYVTDSGANQEPDSYYVARPHQIVAFDVAGDDRLVGERLFAVTNPGFPDGIKVDSEGRVYASSFSGVQVFDPGGPLLGEISLPGAVNFTFGGPDRNLLFITADAAIWAAVLQATGAPPR